MGRRHDMSWHSIGFALAWHCLGMSMHLMGFLGISWVVQACQVLGLSRLVMSATQGIHIDLLFLHVHTCATCGVEFGGHVWHVACVLYDFWRTL